MATSKNTAEEGINFSTMPETDLSPHKTYDNHYYAISLPEGAIRTSFDSLPIYKNKLDALKVVKAYPRSRFKKFLLFQDALQYVWYPFREAPLCKVSYEEKKSSFNSLTPQQLVLFRKKIEVGNEMKFIDMVYCNPHYLISTTDTPTILQEGSRHNALHIATRYKQTTLSRAILNTISDFKFLRMLYPDDDLSKLENRRRHIIDLFLNMPDKPLSETPLHFAAKFGSNEIVKMLLSYNDCDRKTYNKFNLLPQDIIYHRCETGDEYLKSKMKSMFEDEFYVPLLRNSSVEPTFGEPCSAAFILKTISAIPHLEEKLMYSAVAGPMNHSKATDFYLALKKKNFHNITQCSTDCLKKELRDISLSDPVKGLERIGRELAKVFSISWVEYWEPLDLWINLSSEKGITLLEHHLKYRDTMGEFLELHQHDSALPPEKLLHLIEKGLIENLLTVVKSEDNIKEMSEGEREDFELFQVLTPYISCLTEYEFTSDDELGYLHDILGQIIHLKLSNVIEYDVLHQFIMHLNINIDPIKMGQSQKLTFLFCIFEYVWFYHVSEFCDKISKHVCRCRYRQKCRASLSYFVSSSDFYKKLVELREKQQQLIYFREEIKRENVNPLKNDDDDDDDDDDFFTPPQSPSMCSAPVKEIFVNGPQLSDWDIDIYRAIENVEVKRVVYPYVFSYKLNVESELSGILKEGSVISRTPASASRTIRRSLLQKTQKKATNNKDIESLRKTLF